MQKRTRPRLVTRVRQCGPEVILRAASLCDGHSILTPQAFAATGLPADVVAHLTRTHRTRASRGGTIFVGGTRVSRLRGVDGLDALRFLARALGVGYRAATGRAPEAQNIRAALREHFRAPDAPPRG